MILSNEYAKYDDLSREELMVLIKLLNPFSPHITEEINEMLGNKDSLVYAFWPQFDPKKVIDKEVEIAVQVNGKLRGTIFAPLDAAEKLVEQLALNLETVKSQTSGKTIRKIIVVKNKIVNIVV
jgi:leucyl-tRNA synthetase